MKKHLTLTIVMALSCLSYAQVKVTSSGDFAIGQNFGTTGVKCKINAEQKIALSIKTSFGPTNNWAWNSISDCINPLTKSWIAGVNGSNNFFATNGGTVFATSVVTTSDSNLKTNITPINNSQQLINQLTPYYYDYKLGFNGDFREGNSMYTNQIGFLAQDVKQILPQLVFQDEDTGVMAINYTGIIPLLVDYVQKQNLRIEALEDQIAKSNYSSQAIPDNISTGDLQSPDEQGTDQEPQVSKITIQPNPNKGIFNVNAGKEIKENQIMVTDLSGKIIEDYSTYQKSPNSIELNLSNAAAGIYYVHLTTNNQVDESIKVVIQK